MMACQFSEEVDVASHQPVLRYDRNWVSELRKHFQATAGDPQFALDRLIGISHAAHDEDLRFPFRRRKFLFEQLRPVLLNHDSAFKIKTGREPEVLVGWPREAIDA